MNKVCEFLDSVCSKIRCREVRADIRDELSSHIDSLISEYKTEGMSDNDAENLAIKQMGSSEQLGIMLDAVHRPFTDIILFILLLIVAAFGIVGMYFCQTPELGSSFAHFLCFAAAGAAVLLCAYFFDYTLLEKFALPIYVVSVALCFFTALFSVRTNGRATFLTVFGITASADIFIPLFCISFAGILSKLRTFGAKGLILAAAAAAFTFIPLFLMPSMRLIFIMCICYTLMLCFSYANTGLIKQKALRISIICAGGAIICFFAAYPAVVRYFAHGNSYLGSAIKFRIENAAAFGASGAASYTLPSAATDFALVSFFARLGIVPGCILIAAIFALILRLITCAFKIKNPFGNILAAGAAAALSVQFIIGISVNLGIYPVCSAVIPFISYGGTSYISCMLLAGLILSARRRDNILPLRRETDGRINFSQGKLTIDFSRRSA